MDGWALVLPDGPQGVAPAARVLLSLAARPEDVRTQRGGTEFLVPEALADAYRDHVNRPRRGKKGTDG